MSEIVKNQDRARLRQIIDDAERIWGTAFDDKNTLNDWASYIGIYTARATDMRNKYETDLQYDALLKVAGLALTAAARVRQGKVAKRHYDGA